MKPLDPKAMSLDEILEKFFIMRAAMPDDDLADIKARNESGAAEVELANMLRHWADEQRIEKVDRFEVIDDTGRAYVKGSIYGSPVKLELSYQDGNRTLKVFVSDKHSSKEDI